MTLLRYDPLADVPSLHREADRPLRQVLPPTPAALRRPVADVFETDEALTVIVELPGARPDAVDVQLEAGTLSVAAELPATPTGDGALWRRRDRRTGTVAFRLALPDGLDLDAATARLDAGLLHIEVPRSAAARPRRITVSAA